MSSEDELKPPQDSNQYDISEIDSDHLDEETQKNLQEIITIINQEDSFDEELEQILGNFNEITNDLSKLQTQILLLITKYLKKAKEKYKKGNLNIEINNTIITTIEKLSTNIVQKKSAKNNRLITTRAQHNISKQAKEDLKKTIKNFAVYEIYKCLNPRRIAGETKIQNFVHNMIIGGLGRATQYSGGSKSDLSKYSKEFIEKLQNKHQGFKRNPTITQR